MTKQAHRVRSVAALLFLAAVLLSWPAPAQDDVDARLFGSWRLVSFKIMDVGDEAAPGDVFGDHPFGRLILTPEHYMAAYLSRPGRKPPTNQAEAAALLSSMIAYTGKFRVAGDALITTVDGAWDETFKANEQVRYFTLEGDKLSIRTAEWESRWFPWKRKVGVLVWERE